MASGYLHSSPIPNVLLSFKNSPCQPLFTINSDKIGAFPLIIVDCVSNTPTPTPYYETPSKKSFGNFIVLHFV